MKYALTNCKILNGKKDMTPTPGFVLVDGDKIEDVFYNSAFEKEKYPDFEIIDLGGKYLMPGLINMHVHLAGNGKPQKKHCHIPQFRAMIRLSVAKEVRFLKKLVSIVQNAEGIL